LSVPVQVIAWWTSPKSPVMCRVGR